MLVMVMVVMVIVVVACHPLSVDTGIEQGGIRVRCQWTQRLERELVGDGVGSQRCGRCLDSDLGEVSIPGVELVQHIRVFDLQRQRLLLLLLLLGKWCWWVVLHDRHSMIGVLETANHDKARLVWRRARDGVSMASMWAVMTHACRLFLCELHSSFVALIVTEQGVGVQAIG